MTEWKEYKLGEIAEIIGGGTPNTSIEEYWNGDIPWLTPKDLTSYNRIFISDGERSITEKGLKNSSAKLLPKGTVLLSSRAPIGYVAIASNPICTNQGFKSLICNPSIVDNLFMYYWVKNNVEYLQSLGTGTTFAEISGSVVKSIDISLPPLPTQRRIAAILSSLDDKIDLLHRENATLEQMAETLFRQWFVVEAKEEWEEVFLEDIAILNAGGDKPKIVAQNRTSEYNVPIYSNGIDNDGLYGYTDRPRITEESVTISARGTIGFVALRTEPFVPIVRLITLRPKEMVTTKFLYYWAKSQNINGTGTTQQQLTVPDFKQTKLSFPPKDLIVKFTYLTNQYFDKILLNNNQIQTLIQTRDGLLPKLMSGEVKI